jgi:hypothetical protein
MLPEQDSCKISWYWLLEEKKGSKESEDDDATRDRKHVRVEAS